MDEGSRGSGRPTAVDFYTRTGCPFSLALSWKLRRRRVPVRFHDIWADPEAAAFVRSVAGGNETVPTVVVGDVVLVAPSARRVVSAWKARDTDE
jgi:mycoredoxin